MAGMRRGLWDMAYCCVEVRPSTHGWEARGRPGVSLWRAPDERHLGPDERHLVGSGEGSRDC